MEFADTHAHLTLGELAADPEAAWERARAAGVTRIILVGIDAASSRTALEFAENREGLFVSAGIHPNESGNVDLEEEMAAVAALLEHPKVVAVGETGIDLYWKKTDLDTQVRALEAHAEMALAGDLPLVLHLRDAFAEAAGVLAPFAARGLRSVVHCFTGGPEDLPPFLDMGCSISFSGILTYSGAGRIREAAALVPAERCLLETDAPWLTPRRHRGRTNEPAFLTATAEALAGARGCSLAEIAALTTANALRTFRLD